MEKKTPAQVEAEKKQLKDAYDLCKKSFDEFKADKPEDLPKYFQLMTEMYEAKAAMEQKNFDAQIEEIKAVAEEAKEAKAEEIKGIQEKLNISVKAIEMLDVRVKSIRKGTDTIKTERKTFGDVFTEAISEAFETRQDEFKAFQKDRNATFSIELKTVGNMLLSSNLTGDGVAAYNQRQGLVPSQKLNFRDLMPTTVSPTGLYVTYRETGSEGSISAQTEGSSKTQIDYDLTEVKVVSDYISGFARFSKQMMYQLPFLTGTLQRMLLRDFYKAENAAFFTAVSGAATGSTTAVSGLTNNDAEQLLGFITNQLSANFNASYALTSFAQWARLLATKPSDYSVPGGMVIDAAGNIRIAGVPVIGAAWVTDDKALIIDADYLERVETESLRIDFSYEDADNFTKNLVTARVECFEDVNLLRTDAMIYGDFGNES